MNQGLRLRVQRLGFTQLAASLHGVLIWGLGFRVYGSRFTVLLSSEKGTTGKI